ncbi:MAG: hypothetical protein P4M04_09785 [Acidobacteriota bacterium]|nr:hypothetical protein [Acidobacteriota bacterium]
MPNTAMFASSAQQIMNGNTVDVNGKTVPVRRRSRHRLRTLAFTMDGRDYQAIEQNAEKPSRWGQLARERHQVVQFKDAESNKFVAVAVDGEGTIYGGRERRKGSAGQGWSC